MNVCVLHECVFQSIQYLFGLYDLELIDVFPQKTHGGSMRYQLAHEGAFPVKESVSR